MTDEQLLTLNQMGFIPGPGETEVHFLARIQATEAFYNTPPKEFQQMEKIPDPHWDWVRHHLKELYDFQPDSLAGFYSNQKLAPWQGAASWIIDSKPGPLCAIQLRKGFRKGTYLKLYTRDEILAHEAVHAARCAFEEPKGEEFFAYMTSISKWRRILGPMIQKPWEAGLFLGFLGLGAFLEQFMPVTLLLSFAFARLSLQHFRFRRASKRLMQQLKDERKVRAVLFRLTDLEIKQLSEGKPLVDDGSLRFQVINKAYF